MLHGKISGDLVLVAGKGLPPDVQQLTLVVAHETGGLRTYPLNSASDGSFDCTCEIGPSDIVQFMEVCAVHQGAVVRFQRTPGSFFLDRLLCRNLEEINQNVRWHGRIEDFDTRFFAVKNSFKLLSPDLGLAVYCLVAVGYTAIELQNSPVCNYIYTELKSILNLRLAEIKGEPKISFLTHILHHAVMQDDIETFENVVAACEQSFPVLKKFPVATYNYIVVMVLAGIYFLQIRNKPRAAEFFEKCEHVFRVAADGYPRDLVKYRELTSICQRAYWARIGFQAAKGWPMRPELNIKMFDPATVAAEVCRLYGPDHKKRFASTFMAMCQRKASQSPAVGS
jgi:hypothetical protein